MGLGPALVLRTCSGPKDLTSSGLSTVNKDQIAERGARMARRDDREYREYLREEQRRQAGCPAREVVLVQRGPATRVLVLASLSSFGLARLQTILVQRHCDTLRVGGGNLKDQLTAYETCLRGALLQEYREIFLIAAALCGLAAVIALATLPPRSPSPALARSAPPAIVPE